MLPGMYDLISRYQHCQGMHFYIQPPDDSLTSPKFRTRHCGIRKLSVVQESLVRNRADVCIFCTITDLASVTAAQPRGSSMSVQHCRPQSAPRGNRRLGGAEGTLDPAPACTVTSSLRVENESVQLSTFVFLLYLFLILSAGYICLSQPLECMGGLRGECVVYTGQEQDV